MKENGVQVRILYILKISFKDGSKIKLVSNKLKLRESVVNKSNKNKTIRGFVFYLGKKKMIPDRNAGKD